MKNIQLQLIEILHESASRLQRIGLPDDLVIQVKHLAEQVQHPCVVAVVGRTKAGKSTFVNALLGEDLAKMGVEETTATINYFRYGTTRPDLPVRCYWHNGNITDESRTFLDSLQGNDEATLKRAKAIEHLEYHIQSSHLKEITLVDTPGTQAVVTEHNDVTTEFLHLSTQIREYHHQETQRLTREADAVIYLFGSVARIADKTILEGFQQQFVQGNTRSLNTLGVLAKIDQTAELLERRVELAQNISKKLENELNTVVTVSAGLQRSLNSLLADDQIGLLHLIATLKRIPQKELDFLLSSSNIFLRGECTWCSPEERKALLANHTWTVFAAIARVIRDFPSDDAARIVQELRSMAGFEQLNILLNRLFVKRGHLLRCYRIVNDMEKILHEIQYTYLRTFKEKESEKKEKKEHFYSFLHELDDPIARELEMFIEEQLAPRADLKKLIDDIGRGVGHIKEVLEDYNKDFTALQLLEEPGVVSSEESDELRLLFGLHELEIKDRLPPAQRTIDYVTQRLEYWDQKSFSGKTASIRAIADHAAYQYERLRKILLDKKNL